MALGPTATGRAPDPGPAPGRRREPLASGDSQRTPATPDSSGHQASPAPLAVVEPRLADHSDCPGRPCLAKTATTPADESGSPGGDSGSFPLHPGNRFTAQPPDPGQAETFRPSAAAPGRPNGTGCLCRRQPCSLASDRRFGDGPGHGAGPGSFHYAGPGQPP